MKNFFHEDENFVSCNRILLELYKFSYNDIH